MVRSHATTMNSRNRNGRSHAAFSAFDKPLSRFGSATSRSLTVFSGGEINPLDKYWQAGFRALFCRSCDARTHSHRRQLLLQDQWLPPDIETPCVWVPALAGTTARPA